MALKTWSTGEQLLASDLNGNFQLVPHTVTISLSAADIIAMFTTPITLVAGVAGQIPVVDDCVFSFTVGGTQFTSGGTVSIKEETSGTTIVPGPSSASINGASSFIKTQLPTDSVTRTSGKGLQITNNTGAFATGNGTMKVFIAYHYITL